jgi:glucose uptake protein GlcU
MRNVKKIIGAAVIGFFAFAPPGTMIAIFLFFVWLLGDVRLVGAIALIIAVIGVIIFLWRRRTVKNKQETKF